MASTRSPTVEVGVRARVKVFSPSVRVTERAAPEMPSAPAAVSLGGAAVPPSAMFITVVRRLVPADFAWAAVARAEPVTVGRLAAASDWACAMVDCSDFTRSAIFEAPVLAAWMVWMPLEMPSSRPDRAEERSERLWAVK
ncbi:hypothetical protein [Methylorubrum extorquens]|uniref:hypothetical protein n=1 Tax=Methylorubrum extorquens TaxID=408 RepID=UPI001FCC1756|nr:hypothetical protein [Methylorubrum extorquens]MCP1543838.1 hypothetical protein [Methylorubrum extorquens]MCP1588816.1 hypothetical protein [Methylorubrum extorquens]